MHCQRLYLFYVYIEIPEAKFYVCTENNSENELAGKLEKMKQNNL